MTSDIDWRRRRSGEARTVWVGDEHTMTELSRPPLKLFDPLHVPTVTLMGSGPTNCSPRVMAALTHQMSSPVSPKLLAIMSDIRSGLQYVMQTVNACTMAVSGAGHAAMECALTSLIEPGDVVLVTVHGIWGERASDIATRQGQSSINFCNDGYLRLPTKLVYRTKRYLLIVISVRLISYLYYTTLHDVI